MTFLLNILKNKKMLVVSKNNCIECSKLYAFLKDRKINFEFFNINEMVDHDEFDDVMDDIEYLKKIYDIREYPILFIENKYIGNFKMVSKMDTFDEFTNILDECDISHEEYDNF